MLRHSVDDATQQPAMLDPEPVLERESCKTNVLVVHSETGRPMRLRSYVSKMDDAGTLLHCPITTAALASVSFPTELPPIAVQGEQVMTAFFGYCNPAREAFDEATRIWSAEAIRSVISLGCGAAAPINPNAPGTLIPVIDAITYVIQLASDPRRVAEELYRDARISKFDFARLDGPDSIAKMRVYDWNIAYIEHETNLYIKNSGIESKIRSCAQSLIKNLIDAEDLVDSADFDSSEDRSDETIADQILDKLATSPRDEPLSRIDATIEQGDDAPPKQSSDSSRTDQSGESATFNSLLFDAHGCDDKPLW
jgi:hypothetical protein